MGAVSSALAHAWRNEWRHLESTAGGDGKQPLSDGVEASGRVATFPAADADAHECDRQRASAARAGGAPDRARAAKCRAPALTSGARDGAGSTLGALRSRAHLLPDAGLRGEDRRGEPQ